MDELVVMTKDGDALEVHPTCVLDHQRCGWSIATDAALADPTEKETPTKPKRAKAQDSAEAQGA